MGFSQTRRHEWFEQCAQDVRFAMRTLLRSPGTTATIVLTLALATGATSAIFTVVNGVLLRPLPFPEPDRLVQVYGRVWREERGETTPDPLTGPVGVLELAEFDAQSTAFEGFVGYDLDTRHLNGPEGPERLTAISADRGFFALLGVDAIVGRTFRPDDPDDVVVISGRLWQRRFGGDRALPGRTIALDGRPFTVVGVMPEAFQFPYSAASLMDGALPEARTDVWIPARRPEDLPGFGRRGRVTARLKSGASLDAAIAELQVIAARVENDSFRGTRTRVGVRVVPLAREVIEPVRQSLWLLFAAVGLVLLAACTNVANLLLARMTTRTGEVVTRAALGAGRFRLVRQFLAEGILLSIAGGVIGLLVAWWGSNLLVTLGSARIPRAHEVSFDWQAFTFLLLTTLVTAVVFSLAPALQAVRVNLNQTRGGAQTASSRSHARVRDSLVVVEVALAFILALGAALLTREVIRLKGTPAGMTTENVLTLHLTPRAEAQDYYAIERRVSALPRVRAAGFTQLVPLQNWGWEADFAIRGRASQGRPVAGLRYVTPGYFAALGIPVVRGRGFTGNDGPTGPRVIVVNEALARRYFPGEDPVGRDLDRGTIVGVVGDVLQSGLGRPATPEIFYPAAQNVTMASDIGMSLIVRTDGPPAPIVGLIRAAVGEVNPALALFNVKTMDEVLADSLWELSLYLWLIGLFAALVLALAAIGLYGVMSYNVTSRLREFALRLALGSDQVQLSRLVLARGVRLVAAGLAVGVIASIQLLAAFDGLPMVSRPDLLLFTAVSGLLMVIALAACAAPALRVASVDPVTALRQE
jgi:predicted permease